MGRREALLIPGSGIGKRIEPVSKPADNVAGLNQEIGHDVPVTDALLLIDVQ
jgi:hypothetical protein